MDKRPKRRRSKDNPYFLISNIEKNIYKVRFIDGKGVVQEIDITPFIFKELDNFELNDLSQMNKDDLYSDFRKIDLTEESDIMLYQHQLDNTFKSVEQIVEEEIFNEELKKAINELPIIQRERLKKYYFEDKTFEEIAAEENCTKMAVKFSIDIALEKLSKKFKN